MVVGVVPVVGEVVLVAARGDCLQTVVRTTNSRPIVSRAAAPEGQCPVEYR